MPDKAFETVNMLLVQAIVLNFSSLLVQIIYSANTFHLSDRTGIYSPIRYAPVDFSGNTVNISSTAAERSFFMLNNIARIASNTFSVAAAGYAGGTGTLPYAIVFHTVQSVTANRYSTDLVSPKKYYTIYYGPGISVSGETFLNNSTFGSLTIR